MPTRFLEAPAFEVAARAVAHHPRESLVGRTLGHYRVLSRLGAGGMGEVFLAEDTRLERHVALKVLPADVASIPIAWRASHVKPRRHLR